MEKHITQRLLGKKKKKRVTRIGFGSWKGYWVAGRIWVGEGL